MTENWSSRDVQREPEGFLEAQRKECRGQPHPAQRKSLKYVQFRGVPIST
jgi:hypothetical protein